jgi:hypothetical protein
LVLELTSPLARLFWEMLDRIDYAVALARCWVVDVICGPEPPTPADQKGEAGHEKLRRAFPMIGLEGTISVERKPQAKVKTGAIGLARVSDATSPRTEVPADRPVD